MLIVWYKVRDEREAIVIPGDVNHVSRYDCQYASGLAAPHYPLPAIPLTVEHAFTGFDFEMDTGLPQDTRIIKLFGPDYDLVDCWIECTHDEVCRA